MKVTETGRTALHTKNPAPSVVWGRKKGFIHGTVLDFGAGRGRNADYLREHGFSVFAYDPFNGWDCDGHKLGEVSNTLPVDEIESGKFTTVISIFVLNVVDKVTEVQTVNYFDDIPLAFHVVRNDLVSYVADKVARGDEVMYQLLQNTVGKKSSYTHDDFIAVARAGYPTSRGFQRLTDLSPYGFETIRSTQSFVVYAK